MKTYSIIIPHYNIPNLLQRLLDSIPVRDDVEIIVVDDNSDADKKATTNRDDVRIIYLDSTQSKGAGKARNVGLDNATGKWILFADSDDFFTPSLSDVMDKYKNDDSDVVVFPIRVVDSDTLKETSFRVRFYNRIFFSSGYSDDKQKLVKLPVVWSRFCSRDLIERYHIRYEEIKCSEDIMFNALTAVKARRILFDYGNIIYTVTKRDGSLSRIRSRDAFDCRLQAVLRLHNFLKNNYLKPSNQYDGVVLWAAEFGFRCVFKTDRFFREANFQPYDRPFRKIYNIWLLYAYVRVLLNKFRSVSEGRGNSI